MLKTITLNILITFIAVLIPLNAGTFLPSSGPGSAMKSLDDVYCALAGCAPAGYGLNATTTPGATMHTIQEVYDAVYGFYALQKNIVHDDYKCANNNQEASSTCAANDAEYTGEEAQWASTTDSNLNGALVASGKVYRDLRSGLYWADGYDSTSGQGTLDTLSNDFTIGTGCTDAEINAGTCAQENYQTKGNAIQYCLDLSLDATGDGIDETDWYLPSQKELMQACLDGAGNNFPNAGNFYWSSSENSSIDSFAWFIYMSTGFTDFDSKSNGNSTRCVRR